MKHFFLNVLGLWSNDTSAALSLVVLDKGQGRPCGTAIAFCFMAISLIFIGCQDESEFNRGIDFDLIQKSELNYICEFLNCELQNNKSDAISFLRVQNKFNDTLYCNTYHLGKNTFLIVKISNVIEINEKYVLDFNHPFYPLGLIDTLLPLESKIYPFLFPRSNDNRDNWFLLEPSIFSNNHILPPTQLKGAFKNVKYPYAFFFFEKNSFIDRTEFFIKQIDNEQELLLCFSIVFY